MNILVTGLVGGLERQRQETDGSYKFIVSEGVGQMRRQMMG